MTRRELLAHVAGVAAAGVGLTAAQKPSAAQKIAVVRDPTCGCCLSWVSHLEKAGFAVSVTESADMDAVKDQRRVPKAARSCHTATVGQYVLEGHVPAADVQRLLRQRPAVLGLAVPGMPVGSPGMESSTGRVQAYEVLSFDSMGRTAVFARYGAR